MRPRIRTLKPEMWADEKIGQLSRDARLLFIGLITLADDEGRFLAFPNRILGHVFPYDPDAPRKLKKWLGELVDHELIVQYEHKSVPYGAVRNFRKHQRINKAQPSVLPPPPGPVPDPPKPPAYTQKASIPDRVRRAVARRHGAEPGETVVAHCAYCGAEGSIRWPRLAGGKPGSWVQLIGLELDHIEPEAEGGAADEDNLTLACMNCNRSKGHGNVTEFRERLARRSAQ